MHAYPLGSEFGRHVTNGAFKRRLRHAHDVVVFDHPLAAVITHGEYAATILHERLGQLRHADEGPARHVHRALEAFLWHVDDASAECLLRREGNRMLEKIHASPTFGDALEHRLHLPVGAYVERHEDLGVELTR